MEERFDEFLNERKYLLNVSPKTLVYYRCAFNAWTKHCGDGKPVTWIKNMMESGIKPVSVNTYICALNAYWKWNGEAKMKYIQEEQKILATLTPTDVGKLLHCRPNGVNLTRAYLLALTILDTGLRASEALSLKKENIDVDNLVFKIVGKGGKHRLVPFSFELRKSLYRLFIKSPEHRFIFGTNNNTQLSVRNFERDLKILGKKCGITGVRFSPHMLRHTFASYLRHGGDLYFLSRILGHSSVTTTQIYLRSIGIDDLKKGHSERSLLTAR